MIKDFKRDRIPEILMWNWMSQNWYKNFSLMLQCMAALSILAECCEQSTCKHGRRTRNPHRSPTLDKEWASNTKLEIIFFFFSGMRTLVGYRAPIGQPWKQIYRSNTNWLYLYICVFPVCMCLCNSNRERWMASLWEGKLGVIGGFGVRK